MRVRSIIRLARRLILWPFKYCINKFRLWRTKKAFSTYHLLRKNTQNSGDRQQNPRILVYDPFYEGHHAYYTLVLAEKLSAQNARVTILTPALERLERRARESDLCVEKLDIVEVEEPEMRDFWLEGDLEQIASYRYWSVVLSYANGLSSEEPVHIFLPYIDVFVTHGLKPDELDQFKSITWSGIYFHPKWARSGARPAPKVLKARNLSMVGLLDHHVLDRIIQETSAVVVAFPDFSDLRKLQPNADGVYLSKVEKKAGDRKIVSLLGSLERRKGLLTFLSLAMEDKRDDLCFVCLGKLYREEFTSEELKFIDECAQSKTGKLIMEIEHFIESEAELNSLVARANVLYLVYEDFLHSSNFVTKAAGLGTSILVNEDGYMGELTKKFRLGAVCNSQDISSVRAALDGLLDNPPVSDQEPRIFSEAMSIENLSISSIENAVPSLRMAGAA